MSTRKLSSPESEMTRLKLLWRDSLTETEQDYWREQFMSTRKQSDLRHELREKYHVHLHYNVQLRRFRRWMTAQDAQAEVAQETAEDRAEFETQGLTGEQLRHELLQRMIVRALSRGDFDLGLKAVAAELKVESLGFGKEKFQAGLRTKLQAGLDELAETFKHNPEAMESYQKARALLARAPQ